MRTHQPRAHGKALSFIALAAVFTVACAQPKEPPQRVQLAHAMNPPSRLLPPEQLPESARAILRTIMASHARTMNTMVSGIMVLDYPRIEFDAQALADDSTLARPLTGDATELNTLLPERFFDLQDELRARAHSVGEAAKRRNAADVAATYGRMSETCVHCHASYRMGREGPR